MPTATEQVAIKNEETGITKEEKVVKPITPKKGVKERKVLDTNSMVTVKNGFHGNLIYKSKKTGERFIWDGFGSEQDMELSELKDAKNSSKAFFINNWFLIDDPDVIEYLGVSQFYKNALNYNEFENLFKKEPEEIESVVNKLSAGQKKSLIFKVKKMIDDGSIDSNKVILALEKCLNVEFISRR